MSFNEKIPLILILDIDGTLVGHVGYIVSYWACARALKVDLAIIKSNVINELKNGIARPYFDEFITKVKNVYKNVELFVYTAAMDDWALFFIECFEEAYNVSFNRPIFARKSHCILGFKMLINIIPEIVDVVNKKYNSNFTYDEVHDRVIIFDDNPYVYEDDDDFKKVIKCPIYSRTGIIEDIFYITDDILKNNKKELMLNMLPSIVINMHDMSSYNNFVKKYDKYIKIVKSNNNIDEESSVNYWKDFDVTILEKYL